MRYFIKFSVEYYRFSENNINFAAVMTVLYVKKLSPLGWLN